MPSDTSPPDEPKTVEPQRKFNKEQQDTPTKHRDAQPEDVKGAAKPTKKTTIRIKGERLRPPAPAANVVPTDRGRPEKWLVASLKPHSRQARLIRGMHKTELEALAEKIKRDGTKDDPIVILPFGTIADGHQRYAVARMLKRSYVFGIVCRDLVDDPDAFRRIIIDTNLKRKHLSPVDQARLALEEMALDTGVEAGERRNWDIRDLVDQVMGRLGRSGKHVSRLRKIAMESPIEVQHAVSDDRLPIVEAENVAALDEAVKAEIAAEIAAGADPQEVVAARVGAARKASPGFDKRFAAAMNRIDAALNEVEGREGDVRCDAEE